jgi:hypothetical protein
MAIEPSDSHQTTLDEASAFVDRVGIGLVFPVVDLVLPSLWEEVVGSREVVVFVTDESGKRVLTPELREVWTLAEQLARTRRACVGKHVGRRYALLAPRTLPSLRALVGEEPELSPFEHDLADAVREAGPLTAPELRGLLGLGEARAVKRALERLQAKLVLTQAGEEPQAHGWDANVYDLLERRFPVDVQPSVEHARRELVALVLAAAREASAADVAAILPLTRREAAAELESLAEEGRARRLDELVFAAARRKSD